MGPNPQGGGKPGRGKGRNQGRTSVAEYVSKQASLTDAAEEDRKEVMSAADFVSKQVSLTDAVAEDGQKFDAAAIGQQVKKESASASIEGDTSFGVFAKILEELDVESLAGALALSGAGSKNAQEVLDLVEQAKRVLGS